MFEPRDFANGPPFLTLFQRGDVSEAEISDFIDFWHDKAPPGAQSLPEFLGMTFYEYGLWITEDGALGRVAQARNNDAPLRHPETRDAAE